MLNQYTQRIISNPWPWLLGLASLQFFFFLGEHTFWDIDEPINAVCAREMFLAGNWLVPMFNDELRTGKPILTYWLMLSSYSVFGVSEFSARLPSALCITLLGLVITYFGRRLLDAQSGLIAGLLFMTSLHMTVMARAATPDAIFLLTLCTGLLAGLCYCVEDMRPKRMLMLAYVCFGLATLAKGPVSLLMPGLILLAYLLLTRQLNQWRQFHIGQGLIIMLLLALPWYSTVWLLTDGEWVQRFLFTDNIGRFLAPMEGHKGFPGYYLLTVLLGLFPWSGLLIGSLIHAPWRPSLLRLNPMRAFLLCWIVTFFIFFTVARTQLPNYMLPIYPALALLIAMWIRDAESSNMRRYLLWGAGLLAGGMLICGGIALQMQWPGDGIYALTFLPVCLAVLAAIRWRALTAPLLGGGMLILVLTLVSWVLPGLNQHKVSQQLGTAATAAGFGDHQLATYKYFQPSLLYYHGGKLPVLHNFDALSDWLKSGQAVVMPQSSLTELPADMQAQVHIHSQGFGMYARRELILLSFPISE